MIDGIILPEQTEKLIQEMIPFYGEDKQEVIRTIITIFLHDNISKIDENLFCAANKLPE
jgi:hypothetical protein